MSKQSGRRRDMLGEISSRMVVSIGVAILLLWLHSDLGLEYMIAVGFGMVMSALVGDAIEQKINKK